MIYNLQLFSIIHIVNTLYFKGKWLIPFHPAQPSIFTVGNQHYNHEMMHLYESHNRYIEDSSYQFIKMDYMDSTICMSVLLPKER